MDFLLFILIYSAFTMITMAVLSYGVTRHELDVENNAAILLCIFLWEIALIPLVLGIFYLECQQFFAKRVKK